MEESRNNSPCLPDYLQIDDPKRMCDCDDKKDEFYLIHVEVWLNHDLDHPKKSFGDERRELHSRA
ncbi:hypothetical protein LguiB_020982 [Lonicera macranthoides]